MARYTKDSRGNYNTTITLPDGTRRHLRAKTIKELEEKRKQAESTPMIVSRTLTVRDYALRWFQGRAPALKYKSREMYATMIDRWICHPSIGIGSLRMAALRPMVIQEFLQRVKAQGDSAQPLQRTCEQLLITLRQIEKSAMLDGVVVSQYCYGVRIDRQPRQPKRALTPEEEAATFEAQLPYEEKAALLLLYGCWLRRGELVALRTDDIDLDARTVTVARDIVWVGNEPLVQDAPKTGSGFRTVPIPASIYDTVAAWVRMPRKNSQLFPGRRTHYMTACGWRRMWERIVKAMQEAGASCDGLTPHIFRHNYATQCYYSDLTPLMAAKLMGHADTTMIERVYAHLDQQREEVAAKLDMAFARPSDRPPVRLVN